MAEDQRPTPPNTISDAKWNDLMRRRDQGRTRSPFDPAVVERREQDKQQAKKRRWS